MTSTNDGKDVKSNQTSGQKGKKYYIELYNSLDAHLNSDCDLRTRTAHLCSAWARIHSICRHALPASHTLLLAWLERHTARVILQTEWQSPSSKDEHETFTQALDAIVEEIAEAASERDGARLSWEDQLEARALWFKGVLSNPWDHPVLRVLLDPRETPPSDDDVIEWLKGERNIVFVTRLRQLVASKCDDLATSLAAAVMDRVRAARVIVPDAEQAEEQKDKPPLVENKSPTFEDRLRLEAGFTDDVWALLTDIEFVLLLKVDKTARCIELAKQTPLRSSYELIQRLQKRHENAKTSRDKKLWKNSIEVATLIAQVVIARCMVVSVSSGISRGALYWCVRALAGLLDGAQLRRSAVALATPAISSHHLYWMAKAVHMQKNTEDMKPFVCELYVRAITFGMNELEKLKLDAQKQSQARLAEQTLATWFLELGGLFASDRFKCECTLTAFSVHPSPDMYKRIKEAPDLPKIAVDLQEPKDEVKSEYGSWATDSRSQTNFVKTSEHLKMKQSQHQANVLSTAILTEGEALGLGVELCQDIAVLLSGPRVKTLSWDMDRTLLLENCRQYMERTGSGTRALTTELKYLNINPDDFQHLPEEEEDENDLYYGIEKGYEHLVEFQEPEPEPVTVWENSWEDSETYSSGMESDHTTFSRRKKKSQSDSEDCDPLSLVATEYKKKKERPHSKERSKERRKPKKEGVCKEKKEKKERKKKEKISKQVDQTPSSLSKLVGVKVARVEEKYLTAVNDGDNDGQGILRSEENDQNVIYDGHFSMDELKSPERRSSGESAKTSLSSLSGTKVLKAPLNDTSLKQAQKVQKSDTGIKLDKTTSNVKKPTFYDARNEEVKRRITKLLQFRRKKLLGTTTTPRPSQETVKTELSSLVGSKIVQPQEVSKNVSSSETSKPGMTQKQAEQLSYLSQEVNQLLISNKIPTGVKIAAPDKAMNLSKKTDTCSRTIPINADYTKRKHTPNITNASLNAPSCTPQNQPVNLIKHIDYKSNIGQIQPQHSLLKKPEVEPKKEVKPYNLPQTAFDAQQKHFQQFLKDLQDSVAMGMDKEKKNVPSRKVTTMVGMSVSNLDNSSFSPSAKADVQCKKGENAPNTFARLSYMHKKQVETKPKQVSNEVNQTALHNSISAELDKRVADFHKLKNLQNKGLTISQMKRPENPRVEVQSVESIYGITRNHPILTNMLSPTKDGILKTMGLPNENIKKTESPVERKSTLSEKDQQDLMVLLRQKNYLNESLTQKKQETCAITNTTTFQTTSYSSNNIDVLKSPQSSSINQIPASIPSMSQNKMAVISSADAIRTAEMIQHKSRICQESKLKPSTKKASQSKVVNVNIPIKNAQKKQKEDWTQVLDAIRAHKTPSRGPNALDMVMKKNPYDKLVQGSEITKGNINTPEEYVQIQASGTIPHGPSFNSVTKLEEQLKVSSNAQTPEAEKSIRNTEPSKESKVSANIQSTSKLVGSLVDQTKPPVIIQTTKMSNPMNLPSSIKNSQTKKPNTKQMTSSSKAKINMQSPVQVTRKKNECTKSYPSDIFRRNIEQPKSFLSDTLKQDDPFISGLQNSDYDLLEELMDDDLRQEIGELSDEERLDSIRQVLTSDSKDERNVKTFDYKESLQSAIAKDEPKIIVDIRGLLSKDMATPTIIAKTGQSALPIVDNTSQAAPIIVDKISQAAPKMVEKIIQAAPKVVEKPIKTNKIQVVESKVIKPPDNKPVNWKPDTVAGNQSTVKVGTTHKPKLSSSLQKNTFVSPKDIIIPSVNEEKPSCTANKNILQTSQLPTQTLNATPIQQPNITNQVLLTTVTQPLIQNVVVVQSNAYSPYTVAQTVQNHQLPANIYIPVVNATPEVQFQVTVPAPGSVAVQNTPLSVPTSIIDTTSSSLFCGLEQLAEAANYVTSIKNPKSVNPKQETEVLKKQPSKKTSQKMKNEVPVKFNHKIGTNNSKVEANPSDINKNERKVLSEVQEKLKITPDKIDTRQSRSARTSFENEVKKDNTFDQERLKKKRLALLNREISQRCFYPPIPLMYASIKDDRNLKLEFETKDTSEVKHDGDDQIAGLKAKVRLKADGTGEILTSSVVAHDNKRVVKRDLKATRTSNRIRIRKSKKLDEQVQGNAIQKRKTNVQGLSNVADQSTTDNQSISSDNVKINLVDSESQIPNKFNSKEVSTSNSEQIIKKPVEIVSQTEKTSDLDLDMVCESEEPIRKTSTFEKIIVSRKKILNEPTNTKINTEKTSNNLTEVKNTISNILISKDSIEISKETVSCAKSATTNDFKAPEANVGSGEVKTTNTAPNINNLTNENHLENAIKPASDIKIKKSQSIMPDIISRQDQDSSINIVRKDLNTIPKVIMHAIAKNNIINKIITETESSHTKTTNYTEIVSNLHCNEVITIDSPVKSKDVCTEVINPTNDHIPTIDLDDDMSEEFKNNIKIEEIPRSEWTDPYKRMIRIRLPNGRSFKAKVFGAVPVSYETLFSDPAFREILNGKIQEMKQFTLSIKNYVSPNQVFAPQITAITNKSKEESVETVNLVSDDEEDELKLSFTTEFGTYLVKSITKDLRDKHQMKFSQKCSIKITKCDKECEAASKTKTTSFETPTNITNKSDIFQGLVEAILKDTASLSTENEARLKSVTGPNEVIEIDDSSNDSITCSDSKNLPPNQIIELKSLLLADLGVNDLLSESKSKEKKSKEFDIIQDIKDKTPKNKTTENGTLKTDYSEILKKKCFVKLINCDNLVKSVEDSSDESVISELIVPDSDDEEEIANNSAETTTSRCNSVSLLHDLDVISSGLYISTVNAGSDGPTSPVMQVFETIAALSKECSGRTSPVMDIYDLIVNMNEKSSRSLRDIINETQQPNDMIVCNSDWSETKSSLHRFNTVDELGGKYISKDLTSFRFDQHNFFTDSYFVCGFFITKRMIHHQCTIIIKEQLHNKELTVVTKEVRGVDTIYDCVNCQSDWLETKRRLYLQRLIEFKADSLLQNNNSETIVSECSKHSVPEISLAGIVLKYIQNNNVVNFMKPLNNKYIVKNVFPSVNLKRKRPRSFYQPSYKVDCILTNLSKASKIPKVSNNEITHDNMLKESNNEINIDASVNETVEAKLVTVNDNNLIAFSNSVISHSTPIKDDKNITFVQNSFEESVLDEITSLLVNENKSLDNTYKTETQICTDEKILNTQRHPEITESSCDEQECSSPTILDENLMFMSIIDLDLKLDEANKSKNTFALNNNIDESVTEKVSDTQLETARTENSLILNDKQKYDIPERQTIGTTVFDQSCKTESQINDPINNLFILSNEMNACKEKNDSDVSTVDLECSAESDATTVSNLSEFEQKSNFDDENKDTVAEVLGNTKTTENVDNNRTEELLVQDLGKSLNRFQKVLKENNNVSDPLKRVVSDIEKLQEPKVVADEEQNKSYSQDLEDNKNINAIINQNSHSNNSGTSQGVTDKTESDNVNSEQIGCEEQIDCEEICGSIETRLYRNENNDESNLNIVKEQSGTANKLEEREVYKSIDFIRTIPEDNIRVDKNLNTFTDILDEVNIIEERFDNHEKNTESVETLTVKPLSNYMECLSDVGNNKADFESVPDAMLVGIKTDLTGSKNSVIENNVENESHKKEKVKKYVNNGLDELSEGMALLSNPENNVNEVFSSIKCKSDREGYYSAVNEVPLTEIIMDDKRKGSEELIYDSEKIGSADNIINEVTVYDSPEQPKMENECTGNIVESTADLSDGLVYSESNYECHVEVITERLGSESPVSELSSKTNDISKDNNVEISDNPQDIINQNVALLYKDESGVIIKGVQYEDPEMGTLYVFPLVKSSDTSAESDVLNSSGEQQLEIGNEIDDLKFVVPKLTYSKRTRKRKARTFDIAHVDEKRSKRSPKATVKFKKARKIDYRKTTATSIYETCYLKEYNRLLDYYSTVEFSYSISFDKEYIDVDELIKNWPIESSVNDVLYEENKVKDELFTDLEEFSSKIFDPLSETLAEEIAKNYNSELSLDDEEESIFNMGFGEGSGRVRQNLENIGTLSGFSAATLSDVKQPQPFLLSEDYETNERIVTCSQDDEVEKLKRYINYIKLKDKVRSFFKKNTVELNREYNKLIKTSKKTRDKSFPFDLYIFNSFQPSPVENIVQVVQVGQLPVSAAAQNPVTCDPRVTQVSDASPSQCSVENGPHDESESGIKTEYTELTTANLTIPMQNYAGNNQSMPSIETQETANMSTDNIPINPELIKSEVKIELIEELEENENEYQKIQEPTTYSTEQAPVMVNHVNNNEYQFNANSIVLPEPDQNTPLLFSSPVKEEPTIKEEPLPESDEVINTSSEKNDQIAHAMNAAGITTTDTPPPRAHPLVNLLSQKIRQNVTSSTSTTTFQKTPVNTMSLQQALAQILPPPLNQTSNVDTNNHHVQNQPMAPQILHIVQGKNASGNQITLLDNSQHSVINAPNATPVLHIVQNKTPVSGAVTNGAQNPPQNTFSSLSLVDTGLQQGGNQLLHIVNTGNQKNNATGPLLKRVNLLTNIANVQGTNEQKMVQFVCKSADGKAIQLNAPAQRGMVLRLQPIETPNVQTVSQKHPENPEHSQISTPINSAPPKETTSSQLHEIKSRSGYEENYAKFIQNTKPHLMKSLPKFNQAFGKPVFQEERQKNEINGNNSHITAGSNNENTECPPSETSINLEHLTQLSSPPLLLRKTTAPNSHAQPNLVQQIKQTIAPMNIQTMHGGVIYTRQIPVNIGGGQTINLITVPTTDLIDDKQQNENKFANQGEIEPSIIKIVPQTQPTPSEGQTDGQNNNITTNENPQPQPVLTQMRIKLPMLSKAPQMVAGARVVRPSFFQIQRNVIGGSNQPVYQQLVLTAAPPLGQQTIRLPQAQTRPIKVPSESQSSTESMSSSTLEQLREFDMVLEQVKERSTVQPNSNSNFKVGSTDATDSAVSASPNETTQQVLYSIGNNQSLNVAYVNRKGSVTTPLTSAFVRSPDSSGIADSPTSSTHMQVTHTVTSESSGSDTPAPKSHKKKSRSKSSSHLSTPLKINSVPPKNNAQKPLEDEQTTQRILYILAEYKEQVENSPDKDKPAPRRRSNPPSSSGSKRKKSSSGSRRAGRDMSPSLGEDTSRTMGSEDSSCGTSQGDCTENCLEPTSPQDSPRKVVRKLTFEQEQALNQSRPQPQRNVIVADGQTITVARGSAGKPATAVLMPANYILPVSMVKGGQQIAIVTNRGPKLLTVGEGGGTNAVLLQRLIGPAGLKPVLARPGVRHVRLPTTALHNLQTFNLATTTSVQPPDSTASPASVPTPPELVDTRGENSPWPEEQKPEQTSSPEGSEPWNIPTSADPHDYSYEETVRTDNLDRTVLDPIPDRYSPDMEAQRIFDKMFDVESKKSYIVDSHDDSPRCGYDIDASDDDKGYQVVHKKDGSHRQHRLAHVSAAALRHKYAILEHELRLQKSLSEECEDLGVDSPSASELFPEAELLFASSPAQEHHHDHSHHPHTPQPLLPQSAIQPDIDDQIATDQLLPRNMGEDRQDLDVNLGLEDVGIVTVSEDGMQATIALDQEEFARSHPNTTFHSEPTDEGDVQPFTINTGLKSRQITSTIFHSNRAPATVLMTAPQSSVISQATGEPSQNVKYDLDNMIHTMPGSHGNHINLSSVLVNKDDGLTRYDNILNDSRELHLSNTASAIVHASGNATQVIRRVCYEDDKRERERYLMDEPEGLIAGEDAKMISDDATLGSMVDDVNSSPERHTELFWESNSTSERSESRRPLDFSSDSDKCCKSPSYDETNSTDSSGVGTHMRLDSVIKDARGIERSGSAGSSADDTHPPLRTYPPKRSYHALEENMERSLSGKTRAGERSPDSLEVRRRASGRGVVKRGCHCCNGSPAPTKPKKPRQRKPTTDFNAN